MKSIILICLVIIASLFIGASTANVDESSLATDPITCEMCDFILQYAEQYVVENKTEQEIISTIETKCALLPSTWAKGCDETANNYGVLIIRFLINKEEPSTICSSIELCPKSSKQQLNSKRKMVIDNKNEASETGCMICQYVAGKIETYVEANSTEAQIVTFLDSDCKVLKSENWVSTCQNLVDEYTPIIITSLGNDESPEAICRDIEICSSGSSSDSTTTENLQDSSDCSICTMVATYAESMLDSNKTMDDIVAFLSNECKKLPDSYSNDCAAMVAYYIPDIITMLENNYTPAQICQKFKFCPPPSTPSPQSIDLSGDCSICTMVATYAESMLESNKTMDDITAFLSKECKKLPGSYSNDCALLVSTYIPDIITLLQNDFTPAQICQKFKFCPPPSTPSPQSIDLQGGSDCSICTMVATYAESMLESNKTMDDITAFLSKECKKLPGSYANDCALLVSTYIPDIITLLQSDFTPAQICQKFKFCPPPSTPSPQSIDLKDGSDCSICTMVATYAESFLESNKTMDDITTFLAKECKLLPSSDATNCAAMVSNYIPDIITMLENNYTPAQICQKFKFCPPPSTPSPQFANNQFENGSEDSSSSSSDPANCQICIKVTGYVESLLTNNATIDEIKATIQADCNLLPGSLSKQCNTLVDEYLEYLISGLDNGYSPLQVCQLFEFCPANSLEQHHEEDQYTNCIVCGLLANYAIRASPNANDTVIHSILENMCQYLSYDLRSSCSSIMSSQGWEIVKYVEDGENANQICSSLRYCPAGSSSSNSGTGTSTGYSSGDLLF